MKFRDFLRSVRRKYIAVKFTTETEKNLRNYALENSFDITKNYNGEDKEFDFHCTVFYSESVHQLKNGVYTIEQFNLKPSGFDLFGEDKNIPVLKISSEGKILKLRTFFEDMGMKDKWDEYKPHITLSYNFKEGKLPNLKLPDFDIVVNRLIIEDIDEKS